MRDLKLLSLEDLLEILIDQTEHHMQLIVNTGNSEDLKLSRAFLADLQREILIRQNKAALEGDKAALEGDKAALEGDKVTSGMDHIDT